MLAIMNKKPRPKKNRVSTNEKIAIYETPKKEYSKGNNLLLITK